MKIPTFIIAAVISTSLAFQSWIALQVVDLKTQVAELRQDIKYISKQQQTKNSINQNEN